MLDKLVGDNTDYSLEQRVFNFLCLIGLVIFFLEFNINYIIGQTFLLFASILNFILCAIFYSIGIKRKSNSYIIQGFALAMNFIFTINFLSGAGSGSPIIFVYLVLLFMTILMVPRNKVVLWGSVNVITVVALFLAEHFYPDLIKHPYSSDTSRVIDFVTAYIIVGVTIWVTTLFVRDNYINERNTVIEANHRYELQNIQLEKLNNEKAKLFSIVAHDIRAPLTTILGFLELLNIAELTDEEKSSMLSKLYDSTKSTSDMLVRVLNWSKIQLGGTVLEMRNIDVKASLSKELLSEIYAAKSKQISIEINLIDNIEIYADETLFGIIIRNLVNNAIKFTPEKGKIMIVSEVNDAFVTIKVIDDGIGLNQESKDNLFKLKSNTTFGTQNEKGLGLGLILSKEFIEMQNGKIWYESNEYKGSTFAVSFALGK